MEKNVPAIRFKGFIGEWELRCLASIFNKIRNAFVGTATPYYVESGNFYLESNNVKNGKINRDKEIFISDDFYRKQSDKWLRTGDLVMVQSGHVGHTAVIPPELDRTAAHALIMFSEPIERTSPYFLNFQFQNYKLKRKLSEITTGNTIKHILASEMKEFEVCVSILSEQTQIGELFQQLDRLIAQHQQKHDKLTQIKKALLEKMFPQQGETTPAIRFKGFSGKWKKSKIDNLCENTYGGGTPSTAKSEFWNGNIPWIQSSDLTEEQVVTSNFRKSITELGVRKSATKLVPENSIAIVTRVGVGKLSLIKKQYATSQDFLSLSNLKIDSLYASYLIWLKLQLIKQEVQGTSIKGITKEELLSKEIQVSSQENEQIQIGNLFQQLDTLITQHQTQLTKLNNIKQSLLSKLFV